MIYAVAIFAFVFVSLVIGGFRALDILAKHKAAVEADRVARIRSRANRVDYVGPTFNQHGRRVG